MYSLLEMLVVIAVTAILANLIVVFFLQSKDLARTQVYNVENSRVLAQTLNRIKREIREARSIKRVSEKEVRLIDREGGHCRIFVDTEKGLVIRKGPEAERNGWPNLWHVVFRRDQNNPLLIHIELGTGNKNRGVPFSVQSCVFAENGHGG